MLFTRDFKRPSAHVSNATRDSEKRFSARESKPCSPEM